MTTQVEFIKTMIEEKGIDTERNLLENEGYFGLTIEMLLDFIDSMPSEIRNKIRDMFSQIDLKNGNLMHYINFLAKGMVESV